MNQQKAQPAWVRGTLSVRVVRVDQGRVTLEAVLSTDAEVKVWSLPPAEMIVGEALRLQGVKIAIADLLVFVESNLTPEERKEYLSDR